MIDLKADDYVVAVWFARQKQGWDWMACAVRRRGASDFELLYRHRHGDTGDSAPFTPGKDDKRWITVTIQAADELGLLTSVDRLLAEKQLGHVERVLVRGNTHSMMNALADKPWAHAPAQP